MTRPKPLTSRQKKFVENYIFKGMTISESYRRSGYVVGSGKVQDYSSKGCRLLKQGRIQDYLNKCKEKSFAKDALSLSEKRSFLARVVRSDVRNPDPDLIQEFSETSGEHGVTRKVKLPDKLRAVELDSKLAGDFDRAEQGPVNFFSFIVGLSKDQAPSLPSVPSLPSSGPVIDAEVVPTD
jgi:Terminase small subunit